jgi:hypothetical protein
MITFKQYLTEQNISEAVIKKWAVNEIDSDDAISLLYEYAKDGLKAIQNGGVIYRGFEEKPGDDDFLIMDSSTGERTSKDTDNLYQLMLSASTKMKDFPDRSKSFICVTDKYVATIYGQVYVMIPFDGANLAVSKEQDFFHQKINSSIFSDYPNHMLDISRFLISSGIERVNDKFFHVNSINNQLEKLTPEGLMLRWDIFVTQKSLKFKDSKFQQLYDDFGAAHNILINLSSKIDTLKTLEQEIAAGRFTTSSTSLKHVYEIFKSTDNNRFTALSSEIMTPESTGLTLVKYGNQLGRNVECWFSGKCIAMTLPIFARMLIKLEESGVQINGYVYETLRLEILKQKAKNNNS